MKVQIDPTLRNNPFEFVEVTLLADADFELSLNCRIKNIYSCGTRYTLIFGYCIRTNIPDSDLQRLSTIIANHLMHNAETNAVNKIHDHALQISKNISNE